MLGSKVKGGIEASNVPFLVLLKLMFFSSAKLGTVQGLDYYIFKCKLHGKVVNYPQGYEKVLVCSECDNTLHSPLPSPLG